METPCVDDYAHYWVFQEAWLDEVGIEWWTYYCIVCERTEHREASVAVFELEDLYEPSYYRGENPYP